MRNRTLTTTLVALLLATSACAQSDEPAQPDSAPAAETTSAAATPEAEPTETEASTEATPEESEAGAEMTALAVAEAVAAAQGDATVAEFTEDNDPNDLLGRPNGYVAAANVQWLEGLDDGLGVDRGATVEEWPNHDAAVRRAEFIQTIGKDAPALANEYDYVKDNILIRISGEVKPSEAEALNVIDGELITVE